MNDIQRHNLDYLAAQHAQEIIQNAQKDNPKFKPKDLENTVTKTLGVLQENGVYACFLYLYAREGETGKKIATEALQLLKALGFSGSLASQDKEVLNYIAENITKDLPKLLLAKETLEQMLIYARYGAKAAAR